MSAARPAQDRKGQGRAATLRVSADPWALRGPFGRVKRPLKMKSVIFLSSGLTLIQPNLSHILPAFFLDTLISSVPV